MPVRNYILAALGIVIAKSMFLPGWESTMETVALSALFGFIFYYDPDRAARRDEMAKLRDHIERVETELKGLKVTIGYRPRS